MLTGGPIKAIEQARAFLKEQKVTSYYEKIVFKALRLAQADAEQGRLDNDRLENIFKTVSDLMEDLAEHADAAPDGKPKEPCTEERKVVSLSGGEFGRPVFCVPGLGRLDDCAVLVMANALNTRRHQCSRRRRSDCG
jgi:hypothetical protein